MKPLNWAKVRAEKQAKAKGVGAVYFEHLNRVRDLLKPYNRRLMFWGDIALNHPELIGNIPKDMIVMNWQYGAHDDFGRFIKPFQDAGLQQFVCPGASNWNQIFPNIDSASKNIVNFVSQGQTGGRDWDDEHDLGRRWRNFVRDDLVSDRARRGRFMAGRRGRGRASSIGISIGRSFATTAINSSKRPGAR